LKGLVTLVGTETKLFSKEWRSSGGYKGSGLIGSYRLCIMVYK